jgi:ABC-type transport system involved in cytochrome c biogenesis permease subunit
MTTKPLNYALIGAFATLLLVLASATAIEKLYGPDFVHRYIYGAWWFVGLWVVLAFAALAHLAKRLNRRQLPAMLLHGALFLVLAGAFVTFVSAERGYLHLRQGETAKAYISEKDTAEHALPFGVKLVLFDIEYHPETNTPADYISFLKVDTTICRVSMNKIYKRDGYRLYQMDYDADEMGTTLLVARDPWGIGLTYAGYLLLGLAMLWLLLLRLGWRGLLCTVAGVAALWVYISQINPMTPVLRTPMLAAHVSVIMAAYALLVFIALRSLIALCARKYALPFHRRNAKLLYPAVFLLAAGIFIGAAWANISWGRYWGWDSKETWALITLLVYALPLHRRTFGNPKNFHLYCALAFLSVLMTFFGVTFLLGGMHSYV